MGKIEIVRNTDFENTKYAFEELTPCFLSGGSSSFGGGGGFSGGGSGGGTR